MSLDLKKLSKQFDEILEKETPESLTKWLEEHRAKAKTGEKQCNLPVVVGQSEQLSCVGCKYNGGNDDLCGECGDEYKNYTA